MAISIRTLSEADLESADAILQSAFQRTESWLGDLSVFCMLQPKGVFLALQNNIPAGMVASIIYSNFAYVGLMGVHQEFQGQGIGLALMEHLLAWLEQQGIHQVMLDASQMGQPLYEKLVFVPFDEVYVLQRKTGGPTFQRPAEVRPLSLRNLDLITATDKQAFGADRRRLLRTLLEAYPQRAFLSTDGHGGVNGYLIAQEKRIGSWVMEHTANAELLLKAALSLPFDGAISVVVPGENTDAIALLQRYGFEIVRVNRHMARGLVAPVGQRMKIYAQASISLG
ncbi:MAG: GNAT family N-acetyltransferase [Anaerolineales bacterium]|nr:GNAT family N-acetyltransferase [Anaerolineales bacterium]